MVIQSDRKVQSKREKIIDHTIRQRKVETMREKRNDLNTNEEMYINIAIVNMEGLYSIS